MKFIHIADVHIGVKPDRGRVWSDKRSGEIVASFKNIVDICDNLDVDLLLIAGDLFDDKPTESQLRFLDVQLKKLKKTQTVIVAGDHDYIDDNSLWESFPFEANVAVFPRDKAANIYIDTLNVCITGYSYGRSEYKERILEKLKPGREGAYNILLGHGGDANHMPFSKEKLANLGFNYYALGHIHKPAHVLKNKMAFPGSLEPINYTETGRRGYIYGEIDDESYMTSITWVPYNRRSYVNAAFDLDNKMMNADVYELVEEQIKKLGVENIYRILLRGKIDSNLDINISALTKQYNINEIIDKTQPDYDMDELLEINDDNLLGKFITVLSDDQSLEKEEIRNKALRYGIEALLGVGDI